MGGCRLPVKSTEGSWDVYFVSKISEKLSMVAHACNLKTWNMKTGRSGVQDQPQPHSKLEASLRMRLYLKL